MEDEELGLQNLRSIRRSSTNSVQQNMPNEERNFKKLCAKIRDIEYNVESINNKMTAEMNSYKTEIEHLKRKLGHIS